MENLNNQYWLKFAIAQEVMDGNKVVIFDIEGAEYEKLEKVSDESFPEMNSNR